MNQDFFYKLISGQTSGFWTRLLTILLTGAAKGYTVIIQLRNLLYEKHVFKIHHHHTAVISVGNITLGGTGKTPLVVWLCNLLHQENSPCAVLTRGYKTAPHSKLKTQHLIDEPAILAESCPQVRVIVNPDRVAGAAEATDKYQASVLVMDDGFQHRRLARDLDIVTIDATRPFGYGKMFPAGLLREPLTSLKRADVAVITRCDQIPASKVDQIEKELLSINSDLILARSAHAVAQIKTVDNQNIPLTDFKNKQVFAFCGIGNPNAFMTTLTTLGAKLAGSKVYNDHHSYTEACIAEISELAQHTKAEMILTTQKDWTKIKEFTPIPKDIPLAYLTIEITFLTGREKLTSLINETLTGKIPKH